VEVHLFGEGPGVDPPLHPNEVRHLYGMDVPANVRFTKLGFTRLGLMMMSASPFGPVGCGRPLRGGETSKHTIAHNPS
jgi:hypothetical protein